MYLFRRIKLVAEENLILNPLRVGESRILIPFVSKKRRSLQTQQAQ